MRPEQAAGAVPKSKRSAGTEHRALSHGFAQKQLAPYHTTDCKYTDVSLEIPKLLRVRERETYQSLPPSL